MNNVDLGKYKKLVQDFWDPEPKNDEEPLSSIWCLGIEYPPPPPPPEAAHPGGLSCSSDWTLPYPPKNAISDPASINNNDNNNNGTSSRHSNDDDTPDRPALPPGDDTAPQERHAHAHYYHSAQNDGDSEHGWPPSFLDDFEAKMWLTYRSNFPAIPKSDDPNAPSSMTLSVRLRSQLVDSQGFTSDTGWGCMIRSGQSLLANALSILSLGRDWRRGPKAEEESRLLSLFADHPQAPFSIHRFVEYGASACGKHPGEWFGPSATAMCIQALSQECKHAGLNVYVTSDGSDVYEDKFRQIAGGSSTGSIRPTLILLGIRLGIDRITPLYWEALKAVLKCRQSVGIAGGRPSSSHYFVGVQGSHFFYLDPHHTRPALSYRSFSAPLTNEELDSYHTRRLRRLHIKEMDPSMLVGFLIRDEDDWTDWKQSVCRPPAPVGGGSGGKPIFHVFDHESSLYGPGSREREGAVDEVEALDDDLSDEAER